MAYSTLITANGFVEAYTKILRYVCEDLSTPGKDWEIVWTELDTSANNFSYIDYSGSLDVNSLDTWYYLPTCYITEYTFTDEASNTLVEGTDYELDWKLGKIKFLTGTPPYTVNYNYKFKRFRTVLKNTGLSGEEEIYIGLLMISPGYDKANVIVRSYKTFTAGYTDFFDTIAGNGRNSNFDSAFGLWDGSIYLWVFSNKQRIIIVVRNDTYYSFAYVGKFNQFAFPSEYPYPLACIGDLNATTDANNSNIRWYSSTDGYRRFIAKAYFGTTNYFNNQICYVDGIWVRNATLDPTTTFTSNWIDIAYIDGYDYVLFPVYILYNNMTLGEFDGIYFSPLVGITSESTITVGTDTYIVFQNCFRTTYHDYMAIKCE